MAAKRKTQHTTNSSQHDGKAKLTKKIALGAAGVAVTAGVVAAGAALMNKRNRDKMGKMVDSGKKMLEDQMPDMYKMYQRPTAHQVRGGSKSHSKKRGGKGAESAG